MQGDTQQATGELAIEGGGQEIMAVPLFMQKVSVSEATTAARGGCSTLLPTRTYQTCQKLPQNLP